MEKRGGSLGPKSIRGMDQGKEVALNQATTRIAPQLSTEWHESILVPIDHWSQCIDDQQRADFRMFQSRARRITESKSTDEHVPVATIQFSQSEMRKGNLHFVKE